MRIVLATGNSGKIHEMVALLGGLPLTLLTPDAIGSWTGVEEDQPTLEGNALKKARSLSAMSGLPAMADDTGLEVDALLGAPGVKSARFAGDHATDADNRSLLLERLRNAAVRTARFRTVIALVEDGDGESFEGVCEGRIAMRERGAGGFGYDALFIPEGQNRTFGEMSAAEKNAISHRGKALRTVRAYLAARLTRATR